MAVFFWCRGVGARGYWVWFVVGEYFLTPPTWTGRCLGRTPTNCTDALAPGRTLDAPEIRPLNHPWTRWIHQIHQHMRNCPEPNGAVRLHTALLKNATDLRTAWAKKNNVCTTVVRCRTVMQCDNAMQRRDGSRRANKDAASRNTAWSGVCTRNRRITFPRRPAPVTRLQADCSPPALDL